VIEHLNALPQRPARVVIAGAAGFVGNAIASRLERDATSVLRLSRREVDLGGVDAHDRLAALLRPGDVFVAAAARAPCRNADLLVENMAIARTLVLALAAVPPAHVVNISSDAVYADSPEPLTETSCASPGTLHGAMHLAREVMLATGLQAPLLHLRPSLLYGAADPHNGYGPNRFRRLAARGEDIVLFGEGEERRDHVYIDDLAELAARSIFMRSRGVLNVATGEVHSFRAIAERVAALSRRTIGIRGTTRSGPMPHNGYRPFDVALCMKAFPDFRYTRLDEGLARARGGEASDG
jgi:nucleoside-diphosphate-sugar epimerase